MAVLVGAVDAAAQSTFTTDPASPTNLTPVTIIVTIPCGSHGAISQNGFVFDIQTNYNCITAPPNVDEFDVGLLAPGTYIVREVDMDNPSSIQVLGSFTVEAAPIPVLDPRGLAALALVLTLVSFVALRRINGV